jgi:acyl-[acyl-carrier-protein]-phospholipid O-acyltransferase/long-chain-fatty-acid--[acyl-carrier-protein] ligase
MGRENEAAALSLGLAFFILPALLLAMPAGFLADRFCKAKVITACKFGELIVLALGLLALWSQNVVGLFAVVALTGALAALFAPSKLGCIPETVHDSQLANANGWMGLMNVVPCALGFLLGNSLATLVRPETSDPLHASGLIMSAAVILGVAVCGWGASLVIRRVPAADPGRRFDPNLLRETIRGFAHLSADIPLLRTAVGIAFFWMLASLAQLNIDQFSTKELGLNQRDVGTLGALLVAGVGLGSVLAGKLSGGHIELGLVPLGALGMAFGSMALFVAGVVEAISLQWAFASAGVSLVLLGVSAGLFDVPLEAYLQFRSEARSLGATLAAVNFLTCLGVLVTAGVFWLLLGVLQLSPGLLFLLVGLSTIPIAAYIIFLLPGATFELVCWILSKILYRIRIYGAENIPQTGGALLVPNHVTWIDGIVLLLAAPRPVRFIAYADYVYHPRLNFLARALQVIPIKSGGGPKALIQSLKTARQAVADGHCVCIFAEGTLTRTGQLQPFQPGFLKIVQGTGAPVIPVYLHGLWGSIFSYRGGKFFWKRPRRVPYPISLVFGRPIAQPQSVESVRAAVQELGAEAVELDKSRSQVPQAGFIRACRRRWNAPKIVDSAGQKLTAGEVLTRALVLRHVLLRSVIGTEEKNVGIFLPPTAACALANMAVSLSGRTTANLNYSLSKTDLNHCVEAAGLRHILTSRKMLERFPIQPDAELVYLEDLKDKVSGWDKCVGFLQARLIPAPLLDRILGLHRLTPDGLNTIIFTSGSTGEPKGVMLTNHNISGTCELADQVFQIKTTDSLLGVLPIFHSFGYLAGLWLPMLYDCKVVYHTNPLDARMIGQLSQEEGVTMLFSTPTFLRTYLKRCDKEQFSKLEIVVVGAEKMPLDLAEAFHDKFGLPPLEGYGTTETSGPAAVNLPDRRDQLVAQKGTKAGTVGRPLPTVSIRTVDPETGQPVPAGAEGLVEIKGCNVMRGYLNQPEKTAAVLKEGWYNTGDMGVIDDDGFLAITGRLSRFSKIGGEMVPHIKVEETLLGLVSNHDEDDGHPLLAVTAVPDSKKGERLVVLHRQLPKPIPQILNELAATGLPNLWLPAKDDFVEVEEIPLLGTGKFDLKAIKSLALERRAG